MTTIELEPVDPDMQDRTVTCHTAECVNAELATTFMCLPYVICGGCGNQITDVAATLGEGI